MSKNKKIIIAIAFIFIILWIVGIYKLSAMNSSNSNGSSRNIIGIFIEDTLDITNKYGITNSHPDDQKINKAVVLLNKPLRKVMHASVYLFLALMIIFTINMFFKNKKYLKSALITLLLIIALAGFDEYHQTYVKDRTGDIKDVLIDTIGGVAGILFYGTYYYVYRRGYNAGIKNNNVLK